MSEGFVGEIRMFAGTFAPRSWALCDGQLLAVSQNDALFSLLGTIYGGDGRTTFALPDLRGRVPVHMGAGPGLTPRSIGLKAGVERASLSAAQYPSHDHGGVLAASSQPGSASSPAGGVPAATPTAATYTATPDQSMNAAAISPTNPGAQPHANVQPFTCVNFIICLFGVYPSRS